MSAGNIELVRVSRQNSQVDPSEYEVSGRKRVWQRLRARAIFGSHLCKLPARPFLGLFQRVIEVLDGLGPVL